jgi:hypothetical protein
MSDWKGILTARDPLLVFHFYAPGCDYVTVYVPQVPGAGEIHVRHYGTRFTEEVAGERTGP